MGEVPDLGDYLYRMIRETGTAKFDQCTAIAGSLRANRLLAESVLGDDALMHTLEKFWVKSNEPGLAARLLLDWLPPEGRGKPPNEIDRPKYLALIGVTPVVIREGNAKQLLSWDDAFAREYRSLVEEVEKGLRPYVTIKK
jgi:hypothetical protein